MKIISSVLRFASVAALVVACTPSESGTANANYPQQQPPPPGYYPQQPPPPGYYPQQPPPQQPPPGPAPHLGGASAELLPPLVGIPAMEQEVRSILAELVDALPSATQARVRGIPLVFDPTIEVNAFAGCEEGGNPFLAGTAGLLEAVDAIAQTKATDEMFGTRTYDQYSDTVIPQMVRNPKAHPGLPAGLIPAQYGSDPRRWSRAREIFGDVMAFTFGHELAHHYLGHTGCANGQAMGPGPSPARLGHLATALLPGLNQPNEIASDGAGAVNALDAGRRRRPRYAWSERGGMLLLDYFSRLQRAIGINPFSPSAFLRSHPNPQLRMPLVQTVANTWRARNPG